MCAPVNRFAHVQIGSMEQPFPFGGEVVTHDSIIKCRAKRGVRYCEREQHSIAVINPTPDQSCQHRYRSCPKVRQVNQSKTSSCYNHRHEQICFWKYCQQTAKEIKFKQRLLHQGPGQIAPKRRQHSPIENSIRDRWPSAAMVSHNPAK